MRSISSMKDFFQKLIKFYIVGAFGTVINLSVTYFLTQYISLWYVISNIIGIFIATTIIFFINRFWTFGSIKNHRPLFIQYLFYWVSNLVAISMQLSLGYVFTEYLYIWYIVSIFIAIVIASVANFLINKKWTFKNIDKH